MRLLRRSHARLTSSIPPNCRLNHPSARNPSLENENEAVTPIRFRPNPLNRIHFTASHFIYLLASMPSVVCNAGRNVRDMGTSAGISSAEGRDKRGSYVRGAEQQQHAANSGAGARGGMGRGNWCDRPSVGSHRLHPGGLRGAPASSVRHPSSRKALGSQIVEGETDLGADQDDCRAGSRVRRDNRVSGGEWVAREASRQAGWQAAAAR